MVIFLTILYTSYTVDAGSISKNTDRRLRQKRDKYGCDYLISSCGPNGGCCDEHDRCYKEHGCTMASWFTPDWAIDSMNKVIASNEATKLILDKIGSPLAANLATVIQAATKLRDQLMTCRQYNYAAMSCVARLNPGPSTCCTNNTCDQQRIK
ncbi:hypothetical protein I4U23_016616 [Adineta vaga]|nr:hypothetical protein I4U23_016616 [Adineta vaga]